ncbi:hypothetical protein DFH29DRAFT_399420 [Suillus ampliporus]|nr:hypothetical protein DFH29DRAFT_399420 [Suillus ampliporus]
MASAMPLLTVNSTMPRALLVSEIFSNVISYVGTHVMYGDRREGPAKLSRRTLLALALTCRAFSEQALDALWETITSIARLLQCAGIILTPKKLPQDDDDDSVILTESQLAIISRYAHRVRFLTMKWSWRDSKWPRYVQSFLQTLANSSKILMPNLRGLHVATSSFLHLVPPLLGPRLQHLTIQTSYDEDDEADVLWKPSFNMVLRCLPSSCPLLESFKVYINDVLGPWDMPSIAPLLSHTIQNLQKLHTVVSPAITKDALIHLSPSLTSIKTHLPTRSDLEDIFGSSRGPFLFENLGSVDWWFKEWRDVEDFARLWPRKLTSMSLRSRRVEFEPGLLQVLFDSLHTREAFRYLQCIRLSEFKKNPSLHEFIKVITIDTIRPLFNLAHLQVVDIKMTSSISLYEEDLKEVAEAWPCLEVLLLNKDFGWYTPTPLTLVEVVKFIELCPCLTELSIGITLEDMDEDFDMRNFHDIEPCDSDTLEALTLMYPRVDEYMWERYGSGSVLGRRGTALDIVLENLFPGVKPHCELTSETY